MEAEGERPKVEGKRRTEVMRNFLSSGGRANKLARSQGNSKLE